jgi:hypothetical protein
MIYRREYPNWEIGVEMTMQDALAHRGNLPPQFAFRHFGRRCPEADLVMTIRCNITYPSDADLECHIVNLKDTLAVEMEENDHSKVVMPQLNECLFYFISMASVSSRSMI